jgi:drug/metabolite transporter (DMT)-like permease
MWILYSIVASLLWGLDYTLTEKVLEKVRLSTLLSIELFVGFIVMVSISLRSGSYTADIPELLASKRLLLYVLIIVLVFNVANTFIVLSIGYKNATLSGLIEISYPFFIVLFSWLLFNESNVNKGTVFAGVLILSGVFLVYFFNK